jgi:hypothetical protein
MVTVRLSKLFRSMNMFPIISRFMSSGKDGDLPDVDIKQRGWISKILTGQRENAVERHAQSHSSLLSVGEVIYELQTHDTIGGDRELYLQSYKKVHHSLAVV